MKFFKNLIRNYFPLIIILLVVGSISIIHLGRENLTDWDECIYTQYGKEMKLTNSFLTNHWNGQIRLEKPPLLGWLLQIPFTFGVNELNARIISVIAALFLLASIYIFTKKYFSDRVALVSTLLVLTAETMVVYFTKVNTDTFYTLFIFLGFLFWLVSYKKNYYAYLSGILFGLSIMVKGPGIVAYLAVIFLSIFINFKREKLLNFIRMTLAMLLVSAPWHIYEYIKYGDQFIKVYIIENLIQKLNNPVEFHFGGRLFYLLLILKEIFPWILGVAILPLYFLIYGKKKFSLKTVLKEVQKNEIPILLALMVVVPFIAITRAKTKIAWYVMPMYPFMAIYLGYGFDLIASKFKKNISSIIFFAIVLLIAVDAASLLVHESKLFEKQADYSSRIEAIKATRSHPQKTIDYLVQASERTAKDLLNQSPNLYTSTTFVYGGNACAVYYSDKKVNYYYSTEDFVARVKKEDGLFLIENGDLHYMKGLPVKNIYYNTDFSLFENK